ncbi:5-formyltetrahydrofolate cyclo-ligase [Aneurinibacillus sp. REN35]|uniref:5-formyltetrahydrofolate cyclo-ligase n=1 Tax=Aneurinibacillus sp. REN35 TaxID=3237286 RepID=UPI0035293376
MNGEEQKEKKRKLRRHILAQRAYIAEEERRECSKEATMRLLTIPAIQNAERIFSFLSFGDEIELDGFIDWCIAEGKEVYVPKTYGKEKRMVPYRFKGWDVLIKGVYGIREPNENECMPWNGKSFDAIIVPGVGFTERGERLGYGGGFYDRFFAGFSILPPLVAVCYEMQIVSSLPTEEHDRRVDRIVTEQRIIVCS